MSPDSKSPQQPNSDVSAGPEEIITGTWQSNSHGDVARVSIQFFHGTAIIDLWEWSYQNDGILPKKTLNFVFRAKNLPKFVNVLVAAVRFGSERGFIPVWAVEAEVAKESTEESQKDVASASEIGQNL